MDRLRDALAEFDGTHTAPLIAALDVARADTGALVRLCGDADVAVAATWVVKALVERGDAVDLGPVFDGLAGQADWAAQLHILQCVQYAPDAAVGQVDVIRALRGAKKALVQVWALDAFVRVADVAPELRDEASAAVATAISAKAASLRARARALKEVCSTW